MHPRYKYACSYCSQMIYIKCDSIGLTELNDDLCNLNISVQHSFTRCNQATDYQRRIWMLQASEFWGGGLNEHDASRCVYTFLIFTSMLYVYKLHTELKKRWSCHVFRPSSNLFIPSHEPPLVIPEHSQMELSEM